MRFRNDNFSVKILEKFTYKQVSTPTLEGAVMGKAGGFSLLVAGIVLVILGAILRWDLIDWLINTTGLILILIGIVLGIIGFVQMMSGNKGTSSDF